MIESASINIFKIKVRKYLFDKEVCNMSKSRLQIYQWKQRKYIQISNVISFNFDCEIITKLFYNMYYYNISDQVIPFYSI